MNYNPFGGGEADNARDGAAEEVGVFDLFKFKVDKPAAGFIQQPSQRRLRQGSNSEACVVDLSPEQAALGDDSDRSDLIGRCSGNRSKPANAAATSIADRS